MLRRQLLASLAFGAGALACGGASTRETSSRGGTTPRARTTPATHHAVRSAYPIIAPLGDDVFVRRRDRARALALARSADASLVFASCGSTNFAWLVGADFFRSERLIALVLPVAGDPFVVAPAFEVERVKRRARAIAVVGWEEHEDPFAILRGALGDARSKGGVLVDPHTDFGTATALGRALPDTRTSIASIFEPLRIAKSEEELVRMRRAIEITEDAIASSFERMRPGMRDSDIARIVEEEHRARGVEGGALVQIGPDAALPHGSPSGRTLAEGMGVLIDGGCTFQGYSSDISRTRWFGDDPPARFREIYNLVHDAQTAAIARVKPGVAAQEIDRAARAVIANAGHGAHFTHRLGHGIGMDGHEPAYMVEGNARALEPGFVFSVEPGVYLPGEMGVRLEDDVVCTESGAAVMSRRAPRL